jgi:hypothetical protein
MGLLFDRLNLGVQPFAYRVGNSMPEIVQDFWQIFPEHPGHLDLRLLARMGGSNMRPFGGGI